MSLGSEKDVSLAEAREKMRKARKLLSNDIDPLEQRRETAAEAELEQARATTFAEAVKAYLDSHAAGWRYARARSQWEAALAHANKVFGSNAVGAIDTEDVLAVLSPLWFSKPDSASKLRGRIEMVLSYGAVRGWRDRNAMNPVVQAGANRLWVPLESGCGFRWKPAVDSA